MVKNILFVSFPSLPSAPERCRLIVLGRAPRSPAVIMSERNLSTATPGPSNARHAAVLPSAKRRKLSPTGSRTLHDVSRPDGRPGSQHLQVVDEDQLSYGERELVCYEPNAWLADQPALHQDLQQHPQAPLASGLVIEANATDSTQTVSIPAGTDFISRQLNFSAPLPITATFWDGRQYSSAGQSQTRPTECSSQSITRQPFQHIVCPSDEVVNVSTRHQRTSYLEAFVSSTIDSEQPQTSRDAVCFGEVC